MTTQPTPAIDAPSAGLVAAARLRGDESQQVFDVLLRSLSEPGTVHQLPSLPAEVPSPAWLALALADVDVAVAVLGAGADEDSDAVADTAELIRRATDAPIVQVADAAIAFWLGCPGPALADVAIGTALAPEDGARIGLTVESLTTIDGTGVEPADGTGVEPVDGTGVEPADGTALMLSGPGIPGERHVAIDGLDPAAVAHIGNVDDRFPTGFDTWLFTPAGAVMAISRSTTVRLAVAQGSGPTNDTNDAEHIDHSAPPADQNARS